MVTVSGGLGDGVDGVWFRDAYGNAAYVNDTAFSVELAAGAYDVEVDGQRYAAAIAFTEDTTYDIAPDYVTVSGTIALDQDLSPYREVVFVGFVNAESGDELVASATNGSWSMELLPGTWDVSVRLGNDDIWREEDAGRIGAELRWNVASARTFTADETLDIALPELARVTVAESWRGEPASYVHVEFTSADGVYAATLEPLDEDECSDDCDTLGLPEGDWTATTDALLEPATFTVDGATELVIDAEYVNVELTLDDSAGPLPDGASAQGALVDRESGTRSYGRVLPGTYDAVVYAQGDGWYVYWLTIAESIAVTEDTSLTLPVSWRRVTVALDDHARDGEGHGYPYVVLAEDKDAFGGQLGYAYTTAGLDLYVPEGTWHVGTADGSCLDHWFAETIDVTADTELDLTVPTRELTGALHVTGPGTVSRLVFSPLEGVYYAECHVSVSDSTYAATLATGDYSVTYWLDGGWGYAVGECITIGE